MAKLNVEQALRRAKAHARKGEAGQARSVLQKILQDFPQNQRARSELARLDASGDNRGTIEHPPQGRMDALMALYNQRRFDHAAGQAEQLTREFPHSFVLWNIYGAANAAIGELEKAEKGFERAARIAPDFSDAHTNMGNILKRRGKLADAISSYRRALDISPDHAEAHYNMGVALRRMGKPDEAVSSFQRALAIRPDHTEAHYSMGNALMDRGQFDDAVAAYRRVLTIRPDHAEAQYGLGNALRGVGQADEAVEAYKNALSINPNFSDTYKNMGIVLKSQGKLDEAISAYRRALAIRPDFADAHYNLGNALKGCGKLDDAIAAYQRALAIRPDHADAINNMGNALKGCGKLDDAIAAYQRTLAIRSDHVDAHFNFGLALMELGQPDEAIAAFQRALEIRPDHADAHLSIGNALMLQGRLDDAISSYQRALEIKPDHAEPHYNLGVALMDLGELDGAIASYRNALAIEPDHAVAEAQLLRVRESICDFSVVDSLPEASARLGITTEAVPTFPAFAWADNPWQQLLRSRTHVAEAYRQSPLPLPARPETRPARLKIGYFSADMHIHPCMYLIAGLLKSHDRNDFEIFAFSYGPRKQDDMRQRVSAAVDHFIDVKDVPTSDIVRLSRDREIDVAIDLNGYTKNGRTEMFQHRLAPVQVSFLGYPGSLGADFIDYMIADAVVIPDDQRQFYSENVIYMPQTYMPNDNAREIADTDTARADFGLPEDGFVFCCFNNNYKIGPREFDIWMRLLGKVDGSVLWLVKSNKWSDRNLAREAGNRGIDPARLVFAEKVPQAEHLARHKHADLFIDTFNYNAHTTASDALWGGLPVVTKKGTQFAARVAASLLTAIGLPELITESEEHYEDLILELATHPGKLAEIRARLSHNRTRAPLFDTGRFTRNFEHGLRQAYDLYFDGRPPRDIRVSEPE